MMDSYAKFVRACDIQCISHYNWVKFDIVLKKKKENTGSKK